MSKRKVVRIEGDSSNIQEDTLACEISFTILLNGVEVATLAASPHDPETLAIGFLRATGVVNSKGDIDSLDVSTISPCVDVRVGGISEEDLTDLETGTKLSGCGSGSFLRLRNKAAELKPVDVNSSVTPDALRDIYKRFQGSSPLHDATGCAHSAALTDGEELEIVTEDIARHNAVDRVLGRALLDGISVEGKILLTSGRISKELVLKAAGQGIPIVVSRTAPTDMAVKLAEQLNITVVGFLRGQRMNVYSAPERID